MNDRMIAYCMRCKAKVDALIVERRPTKNGRFFSVGTCLTCQGKVSKLGA